MNCFKYSALPCDLVENELFCHERSSFHGVDRSSDGSFFRSGREILFLDEIGELPLEVQPKLLRALDGYEVRRIGGGGLEKRANVQIVTATHVPLEEKDRDGFFVVICFTGRRFLSCGSIRFVREKRRGYYSDRLPITS
ncbi:sigma 54-interacting transcriptional regulator [Pajaroellobacter abortibovis]|uniref:Sigma-54 factor interaction domain-containing protein n=1 Tax=Pajaroellobacter abortibovis TaxID=1882918 RepID=A0A1L6MVU2_9BACT|nr:sigma 54-interacting transcriptional regulator [Pajaroellobacter abortibovis]APR99525.1 hypothetical protein BCY86_01645 [Pajaroellobacter abortibovis]